MIDDTIFVNKILHLQTEYFSNFSKRPIRRGVLIVDVTHHIIITLHIFVDEAYWPESAASRRMGLHLQGENKLTIPEAQDRHRSTLIFS